MFSTSVAVNGFQAFYYELLRQKEKALGFCLKAKFIHPDKENDCLEDDVTANDLPKTYVPNDELEGTIVAIQKRLITAINNVNELVSANSHLPTQFTNDMSYVFAILADEIFLNLDWEGKERWKLYLLEKQLFQSEIAGNRFFELAEEAITVTRDEDMAFLYLMSLNLGFKGKFRDESKGSEYIASYKNRLYALIHPLSDRLFYPGRRHLIEQCYEYTCSDKCVAELPDTRYWVTCIMSAFIGYIVVSYIVWYGITDDIDTIIKQISLQTSQNLATSGTRFGA